MPLFSSYVRPSLRSFALAAAASLVVTTVATAPVRAATTPLPSGKTTAGTQTFAGPNGGRILVSQLPNVTDPIAGMHAAIAGGSSYFDGRPTVQSVAESTNRRAAFAAFAATVRGTVVNGIALVAMMPNGGAQVVALFDRPGNLRASMPPMIAMLQGRTRASGDAPPANASGAPTLAKLPPALPLSTYSIPDSSGSIGVPQGWSVARASEGAIILASADGLAHVAMGLPISIVDPRAGMVAQSARQSGSPVLTYSADPVAVFTEMEAQSGHAQGVDADVKIRSVRRSANPDGSTTAFVTGEETASHIGRQGFFGYLSVTHLSQFGSYVLTLSLGSAKLTQFDRDTNTLRAAFDSYRLNGQVRAAQTREHERQTIAYANQTIANINAVGNASRAAARASADALDRSTSGFVHYLNGSDVVENLSTGARGSLDSGWAQSLTRNDPQNFRVVPMSEYRTGE